MLATQLCPTLCDPTDCSLPGFSVNGILQARILQWNAIFFSKDLPTQGLNLGSLHCRQCLYHLSHQGSIKFSLTTYKVFCNTELDQKVLKCVWKHKIFPNSQSNLRKKNGPGEIKLLDSRLYCKATVNKTA